MTLLHLSREKRLTYDSLPGGGTDRFSDWLFAPLLMLRLALSSFGSCVTAADLDRPRNSPTSKGSSWPLRYLCSGDSSGMGATEERLFVKVPPGCCCWWWRGLFDAYMHAIIAKTVIYLEKLPLDTWKHTVFATSNYMTCKYVIGTHTVSIYRMQHCTYIGTVIMTTSIHVSARDSIKHCAVQVHCYTIKTDSTAIWCRQ